MKLKWIANMKTVKFLEEKHRRKYLGVHHAVIFWNTTVKAQATKPLMHSKKRKKSTG